MKRKFATTLLAVVGALMLLTTNSNAGPGVRFHVVVGGPGYYAPAYYPPPYYYDYGYPYGYYSPYYGPYYAFGYGGGWGHRHYGHWGGGHFGHHH